MADNTAVGGIGLGKMGVPMAGHLLDAGFALTVHNRSADPEAGLRDAGAEMPIIMLTARQDEFDKLHGFEMGADDYVTKPFSIKELLARVKAVLLRGRTRDDVPGEYIFGNCRLDMEARLLARSDEDVPLTRTEFELLAYFCGNEGKALSRDVVMNDVWGTEYYGTQRSLDSFVSNLRAKIEDDPH